MSFTLTPEREAHLTSSSRRRGHAILLGSTSEQHPVTDLTLLTGIPMPSGDHVQDNATAASATARGEHVSLGGQPCCGRDTSLLAALRGLVQACLCLWHTPAVGVCIHPSVEGGDVHGNSAIRPHRFKSKHLCTKQLSNASRANQDSKAMKALTSVVDTQEVLCRAWTGKFKSAGGSHPCQNFQVCAAKQNTRCASCLCTGVECIGVEDDVG